MRKIFIVYILIIFNCLMLVGLEEEQNEILILPFTNSGSVGYDYFGDLIMESVFCFLNQVEGSNCILPAKLMEYLSNNNLTVDDLSDKHLWVDISRALGADQVISGEFFDQDEFIRINVEVIDVEEQKVIYRSSQFDVLDIDIFNPIEKITARMVEDFTGIPLNYGILDITTSEPCVLLVDGIEYGVTPGVKELTTGVHTISILYENNLIYESKLTIKQNQKYIVDLPVFVMVSIDAGVSCHVYINNELKGETPVELPLLRDRKYSLKLTYKRGKNELVIAEDENIEVKDESLKLFYPVTSSISVEDTRDFIYASLDRGGLTSVPSLFENLYPGKHRLALYVKHINYPNPILFFNKMYTVSFNEALKIDNNTYTYKPLYGLSVIPGAAQIYHNQYTKAGIFLGLFCAGIFSMAFSPVVQYLYYENVYKPSINDYLHSDSGVTIQELDAQFYAVDGLFIGLMIGGGIFAFTTWLISLIDGVNVTKRLDEFFNTDDINKPLVKIKFDLILTGT